MANVYIVARVAGALLAAFSLAALGATPGDATDVGARLQAWLDGTRDLSGRFEQTMVSGALGAGLSETGLLVIERPGRMRWDYLDPERKIAIVDGDRTWLYLEEDAQLILGRLGEQGRLLPALLAGSRPLGEAFELSLADSPERERRGLYRLRLVPRDGEGSFEEVLLDLRAPEFAIEAAEVLDPAGSRVTYRFAELRRNRGVDGTLFRFEAPEGTDVTGSHAGETGGPTPKN